MSNHSSQLLFFCYGSRQKGGFYGKGRRTGTPAPAASKPVPRELRNRRPLLADVS